MGWFRKRDEKTKHQYFEERLSAYLDGELSPRERDAVDGHLATCQDCQWNLVTLKQTVQWTRELPTVSVPRVFTVPVPAQPVPKRRWRWTVPALQAATALVAVLLFAVVAGDFLVTGPMEVFAPPPGAVSQEAPADMVAATAPLEEPRAVEQEKAVTTVVAEAEAVEKVAVAPSPQPEAELPAEGLHAEAEAAPPDVAREGGVGIQSSGTPVGETKEAGAAVESVSPAPSAPEPTMTEAAEYSVTPTPLPTEPPPTVTPTVAPTIVAEVQEPGAPEPWVGEQDSAPPETGRDRRTLWFGVAEIALGALLALLVVTTAFVMIRQRRAR
jgi:anti-sigma factor RsiW